MVGTWCDPRAATITSSTPHKIGLVTIPHPKKDLLPATAASILRQARIGYAS